MFPSFAARILTPMGPPDHKRGIPRNAVWGILEYLLLPCLMFVATPVMMHYLGAGQFGLFAFVSTITGLSGIANLGMGAATQKYVSRFRGEGSPHLVCQAIRQTLTLALAGGLLLGTLAIVCAPFAADALFARMGERHDVMMAIGAGALLLLLQQIDVVLAAAIKGFERFDLAARIDFAIRIAQILGSVLIASAGGDLRAVLLGLVLSTCAGVVLRGWFARTLAGGPLFRPALSAGREMLAYGGWNWLHGVAAALFQNLDRLLIGSLLGAGALASYSVCSQLAQQVHAIPAAGMAFLLPLISRLQARGENPGSRFLWVSIAANLVLAGGLTLALYLASAPLLTLWMGAEFSASNVTLLTWLLIAYFLLSLNVAPYFILLGRGEARHVSLVNVAGGICAISLSMLLVPAHGLLGAALSRMAYAPALFVSYVRLWRTT